jgi:endonuclease/exonuclease/phosphatase family metal-dependent hydrolase
VLAWNAEQLELLAWQTLALEPKWSRRPVFATFRHRGSGRRLEVLGVHARSTELDTAADAGTKKRREFAALAQWVDRATQAGQLHDALMLGDFNAKARGIDADALRTGALASWAWDEASGDPGSRWTTLVDRAVIDHILVSPALAPHIATTPEIVYFDRDPEVPEPPITQVSPGVLKNLTDHRPVRMALDLEP